MTVPESASTAPITGGLQSLLHPILGPAGPEKANMEGKVAVITGGTHGIGFEIARFFTLYGAQVYILSRKEENGDKAIASITEEFAQSERGQKGQKAKIEFVQLELGILSETKKALESFLPKLERLDILILSSGINTNARGLTADEIDRHFEVNALGHYYTVNQAYPLMRKTSKLPGTEKGSVRIVFEASEMHRFANSSSDSAERGRGLHFGSEEEITEGGKDLSPVALYGRTKLAMILYTKCLYNKVITKNGDDIYALAVHPGAVNTDMQEQYNLAWPGLFGKAMTAFNLAIGRDPEQGSYSALYSALSPEIVEKEYNGFYFKDPGVPGKETAQGADLNLAAALWGLSERMTKRLIGDDALNNWDA